MTTETIRNVASPAFEGLATFLDRLVSGIAAGARASHDWQRMSVMSDAELARQGLTRDGLSRAVFERNFR